MKPLYIYPGTHLPERASKPGEVTREDFISLIRQADDGRPVIVLDHPDLYEGQDSDVIFGWSDEYPEETREQLLRYPHIKFINHPLVHERGSWQRWSRGYPDPSLLTGRAPLQELPLRLPGMYVSDWKRRIALNKVMILPPTPAAAIFHGTTVRAWIARVSAEIRLRYPGAEILESLYPTLAKQRGLPTTDEMLRDIRAAYTLQSGAIVKCLMMVIPAYVDMLEHPLAADPELPRVGNYMLIEGNVFKAARTLKYIGAWEFPLTVDGCRTMLVA